MNSAPNESRRLELRFALVGAGRVGGSLASWLVASGAELVSTTSRSQASAVALSAVLGGRAVVAEELSSQGLDLLLLAVPDPVLAGLADQLAPRPQAGVVLHTAGALPAAVLAPMTAGGSGIGAFHPLKAFPRRLENPAVAAGVVFGLEGDSAALALAGRLLDAWGGRGVLVPPAARRLYHFAATLAAGGVVTLLALAAEIGGRLGLPPPLSAGYLELARGALAEVDPARPAAAITGPVARGDAAAVTAALLALEHTAPELVPFAARLLAETARQLELATGDKTPASLISALGPEATRPTPQQLAVTDQGPAVPQESESH